MKPRPEVGDVLEACLLVQQALRAEDVYVLRAGDPHFVRIGAEGDPASYEIKQKGYWLVWQRLAMNSDVPLAEFNVQERLVIGGGIPAAGATPTHLASMLPSNESSSELLIVRGPWPERVAQEALDFLAAARPMLAHLVGTLLDAQRHARQRDQLSALADVSKAFSEARNMDKVLTSIATALAQAAACDWVIIRLYNDALDATVDQAMNVARHSETETAAMMRDGAYLGRPGEPQPVFGLHMAKTGEPLLIPDAFSSDTASVPSERYRALVPLLQAYFQRAHVVSVAFFPIMFQGRMLGMVNFASATKHDFDRAEVDFLAALVSQAATTIKGLRLYRELEQSKEELRDYAERLEGTYRVEHLLARTDALTGLPNRRYIEEVMIAECARAVRYGNPLSVAMADLDHFKLVNDGYGHKTGDDTLKFVSSLARESCREADIVGRWGGDEFIFVLPGTGLEDGVAFAQRFLRRLCEHAEGSASSPLRLAASAGVAEWQAGYDGASLVARADAAMYRAKETGRNRAVAALLQEAPGA